MAGEKFPIELGHVMMFARSIGDPNRIYYDADYAATTEAGAVLAPPTFERAGSHFRFYGLRPRVASTAPAPASMGGAPARPAGPGGSGLHAEQHYVYHRPMKVGDVLTSTTSAGKRWEKEGRRAGKLVFSESVTEYRDQEGGLVVTATTVSVRTERPVGA